MPAPLARTVIAEPRELDQLTQLAKPWQRAIILLALHCGLRRSDCMRVTVSNYNPQTNCLSIEQQKTKRQVTIPATAAISQLFAAIPADADPREPIYRILGGPPSARGIAVAWQRLKKQAGVNRQLWLHDLRRTAAVSIYEVSKDLRVVEQLLGHTSLRSTAEYLEHRDPQKLKPYLDAMFNAPVKGPVQ